MPIARFQLPDGRIARFEVPEGTSPEDAQRLMEQAVAGGGAPPPKPKSGILSDLAGSAENLVNQLHTGAAVTLGDANSEAEKGRLRQQKQAEARTNGLDTQKIWDKVDTGDYFDAAKEAVSQVPSAMANVAPSLVQTGGAAAAGRIGGGALGSLLGGPAGTVLGGTIGQYALPIAVETIQQLGDMSISKLIRQKEAGETPDVRPGEMTPWAVASSVVDILGDRIGIPSLFKKVVAPASARAATMAALQKTVDQKTLATILRATGKFEIGQVPTEVLQDVLKNAAIGAPVADAKALSGYRDTATSTALAGPLGGVAGMHERHAARNELSQMRLQDEDVAQQEATGKAQAEQAAKLADPNYARDVAADYQAAEVQRKALQARTKVGKDATMAEKLDAETAGRELKDFEQGELRAKAEAYNEIKDRIPPAPAPVSADSLFTDLTQPTDGTVNDIGLDGKTPIDRTTESTVPTAEEVETQRAELTRAKGHLEALVEQHRDTAAKATDDDATLAAVANFKQAQTSLKEVDAQLQELPAAPKVDSGDALLKKISTWEQKLASAKENGDPEGMQRAIYKLRELKQNDTDLFTKAHEAAIVADEQQLGDEMGQGREQAAAATDSANADTLAQQTANQRRQDLKPLARETYKAGVRMRQAAATQAEISAMEANSLDTTRTDQPGLFPEVGNTGVQESKKQTEQVRQDLVLQLQEALRQRKDDPQKYRPVVDRLLERIRALSDKGFNVSNQPRGQATAEIAPTLAGTNVPEGAGPESAAPTENTRTFTPAALTPAEVRRQIAQLPVALPADTDALMQRVVHNFRPLMGSKEGLNDVAALVHRARLGADTTEAAQRVTDHLDRLDTGKISETEVQRVPGDPARSEVVTAVQPDMFPDTETQGTIFPTYAEFEQYLAGDALDAMRKELQITVQTAARAAETVAPLRAQAEELRTTVENMQRLWSHYRTLGAQATDAALTKLEAVIAQVQTRRAAIDAKLVVEQKALTKATADVAKAAKAVAKISDTIAKNVAKFERADEVASATRAVVQARSDYARDINTSPTDTFEAAVAQAGKVVSAISALRKAVTSPTSAKQERVLLAFLNKDMEMALRMQDATQSLEHAKQAESAAKNALTDLDTTLRSAPEEVAAMRALLRNLSTAKGVLTRTKGATHTRERAAATEIQDADTKRRALDAQIEAVLQPVVDARDRRGAPPPPEMLRQKREDRANALRKAKQDQMERLASIPGTEVTHEAYRRALDLLDHLPARLEEMEAHAADETLGKTARHEWKRKRENLRHLGLAAHKLLSSSPEGQDVARTKVQELLDEALGRLQGAQTLLAEGDTVYRRENVKKKQTEVSQLRKFVNAISGTSAKKTPILARDEAARAQAYGDKAEYAKTTTQEARKAASDAEDFLQQAALVQAEGTVQGTRAVYELDENGVRRKVDEGTALRPRKLGPAVRNAVAAGNIRTGVAESASERALSNRNPVTQAGSPRGVSGEQAVRLAGKDTAAEHAMLEMSKVDDLAEKAEAALENAKETVDVTVEDSPEREIADAAVAKYEGFLVRLGKKKVEVQKAMDAAAKDSHDRLMHKDAAPNKMGASTYLPENIVQALHDGRTEDVVNLLTQHGSTAEVRANARDLAALVKDVKIRVKDNLMHKGEEVAGLYKPHDNSIDMNSAALTEEDVLHELTHAATDAILLTPDAQLTPAQVAAKKKLEGMRQAVAHTGLLEGEHAVTDVREFAAEVFNNTALRAKLDAVGKPQSLLKRIWDTVRSLLGFNNDPGGDRALKLIRSVLAPSKSFGSEGSAKAAPSVLRAATALSNTLIAQPIPFKERITKNLGLSLEMMGVDMRAPLIKVLQAAGSHAAQNAAYLIRKADARMTHTFAVLSHGALGVHKDAKGLAVVEAGHGPSAKEVFQAVGKIKGPTTDAKMRIAQVYLTAKRASRVGWNKLGFDATKVTELERAGTELMREVDADPAQKAALEGLSKVYNEYNRGLINFLAAGGALSKTKAAELTKHGDYVPFYRIESDGSAVVDLGEGNVYPVGNIRTQPWLQELKGGDRQLLPLNEAIIRNTMMLTDMGMRNMATRDVAYALQAIGKDAGKMKIHQGDGPANGHVVRFKQNGEKYHTVLDTAGTAVEGVPADMLAHSLEGSFSVIPGYLKVASWFGDVLRSGVTRNPMYIMRQLVRDPMAAAFTGGMDTGIVGSVLKSVNEFGHQVMGTSKTGVELVKKGLIHSNIFTGDPDDMAKMALQLVEGKQSAWDSTMAYWDAAAMKADGATRATMYDSARKRGMSEQEAEFAAMEMMNFNKRGLSPTVQHAARMIPFFNAQIQGLNVLYKSAVGTMPQNDRLRIQEKFYNRAMWMALGTLAYAAAMDDDDTYRNARARDRYNNWFIPNPTGGEHIKVPIPFEVGILFKMLPEALLDGLKGKFGDQEWQAVKQALSQQIPGTGNMMVLPQAVKPALEVATNHSFFTGREIEPVSKANLAPNMRFTAGTTELAKSFSNMLADQPVDALKLSPPQIELLARGYLGSLPIIVARAVNSLFAQAEQEMAQPTSQGSDNPLLGVLFQKKYGGGAVDAAYAQEKALNEAVNTYHAMQKQGNKAAAEAYKENTLNVLGSPQLAKAFQNTMTTNKAREAYLRKSVMDPDRLQQELEKLDMARTKAAHLYVDAVAAVPH